ncbi:SDR family NAD(P)-dependent oxidoreductase [Streptomyces sp. NPDC059720]|uniref:SDR family NAD(P)-dependent oxidoreductase n=1 Tax=Streptomyces sp. NPDC059720 TaxID=3346924 RepID=UPI0036B5090B
MHDDEHGPGRDPGCRRFAGSGFLLTAAGSGIGRATALRLGAEGARLLITDLREDLAEHVAEEVRAAGGDAAATSLDATSADDWSRVVAAVPHALGRLDGVHLNAGRNTPAPLHELSDGQWSAQLELSLDSVFYGARATLGALRECRGSLVITSSIHARVGFPHFPGYAAAKGAIGALVRQLAVDYAPDVRVNAVVPGAIHTPAWERRDARFLERTCRRTPLRRLGTPDEVAAAVAFLLSRDAGFITGQDLVVDGGRTISAQEHLDSPDTERAYSGSVDTP